MPVAWCGRPASLPVGYAAISDDPVDRNAAASLREGAAAYWPRQLCPAAEAVIFGPPFVYLYTPPDQPLNATPERFFAMWLECLGTGTSPAFFQRDGWSIFRDSDGTWSAVNTALFSSRPGIGSI
jgi:hypothetical protein